MKISIITINFNNAFGLRKTIESVIGQQFSDYEYLVIDGGSTDGSVAVIKEYAEKIAYWISAPDTGIYNAMNKGILKAQGEYLLFLNSGDQLCNPLILKKISANLLTEDIVYGNSVELNPNGTLRTVQIPEVLTLDYFYSNSLSHPSTFIRRKLFETFGLYNEENKIVSDWEFFIKTIFINQIKTKKINYEISMIDGGGISRDLNNQQMLINEIERALHKYFLPEVVKLIADHNKLKVEFNQIKSIRNNPVGKLIWRIIKLRRYFKRQ